MTKKAGGRGITVNRRAFHDYHVDDRFEAGIALVGSEVKSLREGRVTLQDAHARFVGDELWLVGAHVSPYGPASLFGHEPKRDRKLLMHRRELDRLAGKVHEKGLTLVPLELYFRRGRAKVAIALARGKKLHDKREDLKRRTAEREIARARSGKGRQ